MAQTTTTTRATTTTLRPLHDRVLVQRLAEQDQTYGRIVIPDSAREKPQEGTVIAVGTGSSPTTAGPCRSRSRRATASSSASIPAARSRWTASRTSS